jgi:ribosomal protein S18 acetylase RimI-like enzyme
MKRLHMVLRIVPDLAYPIDAFEPASLLASGDRQGLGELLFRAYEGGPDQEENTVEEGDQEIARTLDGTYGPLVPEASFVLRDDRGPIAATFVVKHAVALLLAHAVVHPRARGLGVGTAMIRRSIAAVAAAGETEIHLAVHPENRARKVYERLGFVDEAPKPTTSPSTTSS